MTTPPPSTRRLAALAALAAALLASLAAPACVPVETLPLSRPAAASAGGLTVEASAVAASPAFLAQRGGAWSVLATTLVVTNRGPDTYVLALDHASLVLTAPGGELPEVVLPITASGKGPAPPALPMDRTPSELTVSPGTLAVAWVAVRAPHELDEPDLRRRIVVRVPVSGGSAPLDVVLADPTVERPRWALPAASRASYVGVSAGGTGDEGSVGLLRTSPKSVVGPVVVAPAVELGARAGKLRGEREPTIVCCDLGLALDLSAPFLRTTWTAIGPTVGYHAVFALESGRIDKATWHGPSAGLSFFASPIEPRVAGALPVRTSRSVLGYSLFSIQYVHWFRRGDEGGSPGGLVTFERSIPEW
jgi:hypothetical protein